MIQHSRLHVWPVYLSDSVSARLEERSEQLQSEAAYSEETGRRADSVASRLEQHRAALSELDPYGGEQEDTTRRLKVGTLRLGCPGPVGGGGEGL